MFSKLVIRSGRYEDAARAVRAFVRQTCGSHGDKQLSIVPGLLVRTMRCPDETGGEGCGGNEGKAMGEFSKSRAWRKSDGGMRGW
jgi:hypothetical protein